MNPRRSGKPSRVVIRELRTAKEFHDTLDVAKLAWGFSERVLSPATDLIAATHVGGLTAGAFEGGKMIGFVHGIPRTNMGQPCQHSHLLAVDPRAQGRGISVLLKLFQRRWCLEHGIRIATWTYDPFLLKNARLNISRLGAAARGFLPNFYGPMGGIYGELPTDRFEVIWRLDDPSVERAAQAAPGRRGNEDSSGQHPDVPLATPSRIRSGQNVAIPFPAGAPAIYRSDHEGTLQARHAFARAVKPLFARGYEAVAVEVRSANPVYIFTRDQSSS